MGIIVLFVLFGMTVLVRFPHLEVKSLHSPLVNNLSSSYICRPSRYLLIGLIGVRCQACYLLVSELDHATGK